MCRKPLTTCLAAIFVFCLEHFLSSSSLFVLCNLPTAKNKCKSSCTLSNNYAKQIKLSPTSGAPRLSVSVNSDPTGPAEPGNTKEQKNGNQLRCLKLGGYCFKKGGGGAIRLTAKVLIINI